MAIPSRTLHVIAWCLGILLSTFLNGTSQAVDLEAHFLMVVNHRTLNYAFITGESVELDCRVDNVSYETSGSYSVSYYACRSAFEGDGEYYLGSTTRAGLEPQEEDMFLATYAIPDTVPDGHYWIEMRVSCSGDTNSSNDTERWSHPIRVKVPVPDLKVSDVQAAQTCCRRGETIDVVTTIENTGLKASGSYNVAFRMGDHSIGSAGRGSVESGAEDVFQTTCTLPSEIPEGTYLIAIAVTSPDDSNTSNNKGLSGEVRVGPYADLAILNVEAEGGVYAPGEEMVVYSLVENVGDLAMTAYALDFYVSFDPEITFHDYHIGYVERAGLAPGQQHSYETTCQLPPYVPAGDCYVGAIITCADDGRTQNNTGHDDTTVPLVHPVGYVCGRVQYKHRTVEAFSVRYAQVEIYEGYDEPGDPELARTYTNGDGYFGVVIPPEDQQARPVFVKVRAQGVSGAYPGTTSTIAAMKDDVFERSYFRRSELCELPADSSLIINITMPNTDGAFMVYDSLVEGFIKAKTFFGVELDPITTYWPSSYDATFYVPGEAIYISRDDRSDRDVILHEYGHYLAEVCNFAQGSVGEYPQHYWDSDLRFTPFYHTNQQAQNFAFREAWPTLFSIATQYGDTWYPHSGDTKYQDYVEWATWMFEIDLETDTAEHNSPGRYYENMNCCALWDIFDDANDAVDNNDVVSDPGLVKIWTVTSVCCPNDIEDFWYGWFEYFEEAEAITRIFHDHEMPFLRIPTTNITGFETGEFDVFIWLNASDTPWFITAEESHQGAYSARSGVIGDSETSTLKVTVPCQEGQIRYWRRISSEEKLGQVALLHRWLDEERVEW